MHDSRTKKPVTPPIDVSPNNPCPFLRALVAEGFVDGHIVPLSTLSNTIGAASGEKGLSKIRARIEIYLVALIANGLSPWRLLKSWWSGAQLDALRDGPLDKHGVGSRILDARAHVHEDQIARLAEFGQECRDPAGGVERGLTASEIKTFMRANFERAKDNRRWYDPLLMKGEWPVLLRIMGKGEGKDRYLSVAEVRTLFVDRRLPERIVERIESQPEVAPGRLALRVLGRAAAVVIALGAALLVALTQFPDRVRAALPDKLAQLLPPPLPDAPATKAAYWLDQNWSIEDRYWFHHVSQGTATFPVPYAWFVALEQPYLRLFSEPGLMKDSPYLERFGFIPSPQTIHTDDTTLRRFGYASIFETTPAPASSGLWKTPVENVDGLPVGFARMTGVVDPATGRREDDKIGLTCAACHTGQLHYKGVAVRFDGGPAMTDLKKLELSTGLSIAYTLYVPFRFKRFADRVLGPDASDADRSVLKQKLAAIGKFLIDWQTTYDKTIAGKTTEDGAQQKDTEEGFGRLDALNRIGNQVFSQNLAINGLSGFEKNLNAQNAPVSFPPIWTVPWLKYAQYDASIEQPLIRNAGEALGVTALINISPEYPADTLFRSSVEVQNLLWIESMLRGPDPFSQTPQRFGGLTAPKWPSQLFDDQAWKLKPDRVAKGRELYAEICVECHLGPVNDPVFDAQFPDKSFWSSPRWDRTGGSPVLDPIQKKADDMGTDSAQAKVLTTRTVQVPSFLGIDPARDLTKWWECPDLQPTSSTEMSYALALMVTVDLVSRKWMDEQHIPSAEQKKLWGERKNCPNREPAPRYRARPLNGVWATAPYLHNGSVPSLDWLLRAAAERPTKFCMGARDFDPEHVGFDVKGNETKCQNGQTLFSATDRDGKDIHGNSVSGHSFEGAAPYPRGIVGRALDKNEREALIEYLKTL
jgi:processive rubber oxygenase RoxA-like protein